MHIARVAALISTVFVLAACGSSQSTSGGGATISVAGSTALLPLAKEAAAEYQTQHADVHINIAGGGSRVGLTQVTAHAVDIGDSDIDAPPSSGLTDNRIAVVGFAVVANPRVQVTNLSKKQIADIFSGHTTNWKAVGGPDLPIAVINRPRSSGTRAVFAQTLMGNAKVNEGAMVQDSSGAVVTAVKTNPGAVSYVALGYVANSPVTKVKIDNVAPTVDNIKSGKYPFWSYEHMYTSGPPSPPVHDFITYVASDRTLVHKLGYIVVSDMANR